MRLSVHCAYKIFGPDTHYRIYVNSLPMATAQEHTGQLPSGVEWQQQTGTCIPPWLQPHVDPHMAEGVGWKLVPPQAFPDRHELALDNDCILFDLPRPVRAFLHASDRTLMAEDAERCLGQFDLLVPPGTYNSGIRGLPPTFDFATELAATLREQTNCSGELPILHSELDEQGLQAAALHRNRAPLLVSLEEVSICSPFWPRAPEPGSCGAHFVGLNPKHLPWNYYDRSADHVRREHWDRWRPLLYRKAGLPMPAALPLDVA